MKHRVVLSVCAALLCLTAAGCSGSSSGKPEPAGTASSSVTAPETTGAPEELILTVSGTGQQFGEDDTPLTDALLDTLQKRRFTAEAEIYEQNELIGKMLLEVSGDNIHYKTERVPSTLYKDTPAFGVQDSECIFIGAEAYSQKNGEWKKETWRSPYFSGSDPSGSGLIGLFFESGPLERYDFQVKSREEAADGSVTESFAVNKSHVLSVTYDAEWHLRSSVYGVTEQRFTKFADEAGEITAPQVKEESGTAAAQ